jgi:membrane protease YdiL (CAAX protease family)
MVFAMKLADVVLLTRRLRRLRRDPSTVGGSRMYRISYQKLILASWAIAALVPLLVVSSADVSAADVGWAWPDGDGLDYVLALFLLVSIVASGLTAPRRYRTGQLRAHPGTLALVPRNTRERKWAAAAAVTAGITEEVIFRGLFIGAAMRLYHLPLAVVVVASLALFVAGHAYQGWRGMQGSLIIGLLYSFLFLISGSVLLGIVLHIVQDLVALLWVMPAARHRTVPAPSTELA